MDNNWLQQQPEDVQRKITENDSKPLAEVDGTFDIDTHLDYLKSGVSALKDMIDAGLDSTDDVFKNKYKELKASCRNEYELDAIRVVLSNYIDEA